MARRGVTNDTLHPLRAYARAEDARSVRRPRGAPFRSRRLAPPAAEGRWSLVQTPRLHRETPDGLGGGDGAAAAHAARRRSPAKPWRSEAVAGGFSAVYQVLKAMDDAGQIRRGYFVAGLGAAQFAMPAASTCCDRCATRPRRRARSSLPPPIPRTRTAPSCHWPDVARQEGAAAGRVRPAARARSSILVDGHAAAYLRRGERELLVFAPETEPLRSRLFARRHAPSCGWRPLREERRRGMLIAEINGAPASTHPAVRLFIEEGFAATAMGLQARTERLRPSGFDVSGTRIAGEGRGGVAMEHPGQQPAGPGPTAARAR